MSISVVVPTKDRLAHLKRFVPLYLEAQEVEQVVVVVDGSTDGTEEWLAGLAPTEPRLCVVVNDVNRGTPYTKNRGIDAATAEFVFIGEDDLEVTPGFFTTLLAHLRQSGADFICGRNIFRWEHETEAEALARCDAMTGPPYDPRKISINTSLRLDRDTEQPIIAAPMLGRADAFRRVRFDTRYEVNFWREETDFQLSAQRLGYRLVSCPHAVCFNYVIVDDRGGSHAAAGLRRVRWMVINNWRFIRKFRTVIDERFDIGNPYLYIARFAVEKTITEVALPTLVGWKRRTLGAVRS